MARSIFKDKMKNANIILRCFNENCCKIVKFPTGNFYDGIEKQRLVRLIAKMLQTYQRAVSTRENSRESFKALTTPLCITARGCNYYPQSEKKSNVSANNSIFRTQQKQICGSQAS